MKTCTTTAYRVLLFLIAALIAAPSAYAQSGSWLDDNAGNWTDPARWTGGTIANGADNTATFGNVITTNRTVTLNGNRTIGNITASSTSGNYTLSGNTLTLDVTTGAPVIDVITSSTLAISSQISGNDGLTKTGNGTLLLSNTANNYTGTTTVNAGALRLGAAGVIANTSNLTINSGATLNMGGFVETVGTLTLNRGTITGFGGTEAVPIITGSGGFITTGGTVANWPGVRLGGNFTYNTDLGNETTANIASIDFGNANRTFTVADGGQAIDVEITTSMYNPGAGATSNFIKTGSGTMRISGGASPNYGLSSGTTSIQDGVLQLNKSNNTNAVGGSGVVTVGDGTGAAGSAVLRYVGGNDQIPSNAITINSDGLFDLNGRNETTSGALTHSSGGSITTGAGTLTLGAATNTISGTSTVTGNLTFSGTAATNLTIGGTANMNGTTTFSGGAGAGITSTGTPQIQGTVALGTANRTIAVTSGTLTVSAQVTGSTGTTTKSGAGSLILSGNNTYSGGMTVSAGTLEVQGSVANSGITNNSTLIFNSSSAQAYGNVIGGTGTLTKSGAGALTLSGNNTYSGATTITNGTLAVTGSGSINGSSGITLNGGRLDYSSSVAMTAPLTFTSGTLGGTTWTGSSLNNLVIDTNRTISPGNSPGTANTGNQTWAGGGNYTWEINNATGTVGADPGWDLLSGTGNLTITSSSGTPFNILITSLTLGNISGNATNFDDTLNYAWQIADFANPVIGFDASDFFLNTSGFTNPFTGNFGISLGGTGSVPGDNSQVYITYVAVPEPATLAILGAGVGLLALRFARRRNG